MNAKQYFKGKKETAKKVERLQKDFIQKQAEYKRRQEKLKKAKVKLKTEIPLQNGVIVEVDKMERGSSAFIQNEQGNVAMEEGSYPLASGKIMVIKPDGVLFDVIEDQEAKSKALKFNRIKNLLKK